MTQQAYAPLAPDPALPSIGQATKGGVPLLVPVAELNIDHTRYQRDLNQASVDKLAKHWDDDKLLPLLVNRRADGSYWVFDGQHRRAAAMKINRPQLPCLVWRNLTVEREAELFAFFNSRAAGRQVAIIDQFRARITAQDPDALAVVRAITRAGLNLDTGKPRKQDAVHAIAACEQVYRKIGEDGLFRALDLLNRAWPGTNDRLTQNFITGVGGFLHKYGARIDSRDIDRFVQRLARVPINEITVKARDRSRLQGEYLGEAMITVLALQYDKRIDASRKLLGGSNE